MITGSRKKKKFIFRRKTKRAKLNELEMKIYKMQKANDKGSCSRGVKIQEKLQWLHGLEPDNKFYSSLVNQRQTKGGLSDIQIDCIVRDYKRKYKG